MVNVADGERRRNDQPCHSHTENVRHLALQCANSPMRTTQASGLSEPSSFLTARVLPGAPGAGLHKIGKSTVNFLIDTARTPRKWACSVQVRCASCALRPAQLRSDRIAHCAARLEHLRTGKWD